MQHCVSLGSSIIIRSGRLFRVLKSVYCPSPGRHKREEVGRVGERGEKEAAIYSAGIAK